MNQTQQVEFGIVCVLVGLMALFPPRKPVTNADAMDFSVPRAFLFSSTVNKAERQLVSSDGSVVRNSGGDVATSTESVEIDAGRLLAETLLAFAAFGIWSACASHFVKRGDRRD